MSATTTPPHVIAMPGWRPLAKHATTTLLMVSLLPMAVFYTTMTTVGLHAAVLVTVGWYYAGMLIKLLRGKPLLAAAMLGAGLLTIRTVIMLLSGNAVLYFLQPVAGTVAVAAAFAATALAGRPVLDRLAHEFCPLPEELSHRLRQSGFFGWLSVVWSLTYFVNAAATVWLLATASISGFVLVKAILSPIITVTAVMASYVVFRWTIREQNIQIRWCAAA